MLTLAGTCAYTGLTTVSGGSLQVNGKLLDSSIIVSGGSLGGTGLITGPVTIGTSGILSPGPGLGTLVISNSLTLTDNSTTVIQIDPVQRAASRIEGLSHIDYAGTLLVNNPPAGGLSAGDLFHVFGASTATGRFSAIQPSPGPGLAWSFDSASGTLSVVSPGKGTLSSGAWPPIRVSRGDANHLVILSPTPGFRLQVQTNSISKAATNWFDYPGSVTSPMVVPIDPNTKALFFRLVP
jgi:autotransporter-associated beta strand protein